MKRILFLIIGLLISVVSLYLAFQGFNLSDVWDALLRVRLLFFALMIVPYVLTFLTKVWRWRVLFYPDEDRTRFGVLFPALMLSYIPLPFRTGELARGVVASALTKLPPARVFSTILLEKVLDVLTLFLLLGVGLPFVSLPNDSGRGSLILVGVVVLIGVLVLLGLILKPEYARNLARLVGARFPDRIGSRIVSATDHALEGLAPLGKPKIALQLGLWSLATWLVNVVTVYLMLLAFNIEVTPIVAAVLVVGTNLSMAVPAAPGYVGTFEAAVVGVLVALGQPKDVSQSFAIIYHFVGLVPVALIGVIVAIQQGINFAALRTADDGRQTTHDI
ncbi:MAG TPA: lysylphosphatidylglycerol synthase transmembrane domain-containing protein [Chloroflexia bacterium]|nr:lysylphosphatidylglycerol synthase transmembrane domain-containing protein [Chloroflexia bacterium]